MNIENQQTGFEEVAELETKQSKALPEAEWSTVLLDDV